MNTTIFKCLAFVAVSHFATGQAETKEYRWKLGMNVSPEMGFRFLNTQDATVQFIVDQRNRDEKPEFLFSKGLSAEYSLSKRFSVRSGIQYSLRGEKSKDLGAISTQVEKYIYRYQYHYIGAPLVISFSYFKNDKISLFASLGSELNFIFLQSSRNTLKFKGQDEITQFSATSIEKDQHYVLFNPSAAVSLGMDLKLGNRISLRLEPNFKMSTRPIVDAPIKGYYYNYGLNIGFLVSL